MLICAHDQVKAAKWGSLPCPCRCTRVSHLSAAHAAHPSGALPLMLPCGVMTHGSSVLTVSHDTEESLLYGCSAAQAANASGVLFSPPPGQDVVQMNCAGNECSLPLSIWASMVPRSAALDIAEVCTPFLRRAPGQHLTLQ